MKFIKRLLTSFKKKKKIPPIFGSGLAQAMTKLTSRRRLWFCKLNLIHGYLDIAKNSMLP